MASTLHVLMLSAIVMACARASPMSKQARNVLDDIHTYSKQLSTTCFHVFNTTLPQSRYTTDNDVKKLCLDITKSNNPMVLKPKWCNTIEYTKFQKKACRRVKIASDVWNKRAVSFNDAYSKLTKGCQNTVGGVQSWADLQQLCDDVRTTKKTIFKTACIGDQYSQLEDAACDGASGVFVGLVTLGLCLVTSLFNKQ